MQACGDISSLKRRWSELERDVRAAEERCVLLERRIDDGGDLLWENLCNSARGVDTPPLEQRTGVTEAVLVDEVLCGSAQSRSRTWQRAHRVRHQPQVESLLSYTAEAMLETPQAPTAGVTIVSVGNMRGGFSLSLMSVMPLQYLRFNVVSCVRALSGLMSVMPLHH